MLHWIAHARRPRSIGLLFLVDVLEGIMVWGVAIIWLLAPVLTGSSVRECQNNPGGLSRYEFEETHMASAFKIVLYSTDAATARRASRSAFERIAALNAILSDYDPASELSKLSRSAGGPAVPVSADLFEVLDASKRMFEQSEGAFDVTIAPVGRLWRRARRDRKLPDPLKLAEARLLVGSDKLVLDRTARAVRLEKPGMKLDVGGIAKGYAADAALGVLRASGVTRALVAGAGDIVVGDPPPDSAGWAIAIAPLVPGEVGSAPRGLLLANAAVSTAGDAEQFVVIDGRRYSHIINPTTGLGVEDRASVTVVARDGGTADALETTVYIMGPERGLMLVEDTPGAAAIFVRSTPDGIKTFESSRFKQIPKLSPDKPRSPPP
jgi:FAD:protein FMN transferase